MKAFRIRTTWIASVLVSVVAALAFTVPLEAGILAGATNTFAFDDGTTLWKGSRTMSTTLLTSTLDAEVDFAVFASGQFQQFLNFHGITGAGYTDPSPAGEFVYVYQIIEQGTTPGINVLTLGLDGDETFTISAPNEVPLNAYTANINNPDIPTVVQTTNPALLDTIDPNDTEVQWAFDIPDLSGGSAANPVFSTLLFFSNPAPPEADRATLRSSLASQTLGPNDGTLPPPPNNLWFPSPQVPEPAALMFCVALGFAIISSRSFRSRSSET